MSNNTSNILNESSILLDEGRASFSADSVVSQERSMHPMDALMESLIFEQLNIKLVEVGEVS